MARATECAAVVARVEELAALSAMHAQLEEPHLVVCAECREEVARTRDVLAGLDAVPVQQPKRDLSEQVMSRIATSPAPAWAKAAARPVARPVATPASEARRPAVPEPPPGFFASFNMRALTVPAFAFAAVLLAVAAFRGGPGRELAHHTPTASPIVEEPMLATPILTTRGAPAIQIAAVSGRLTAFDQGTWKDIAAGGAIAAGQRIQVEHGGHATLALADGTKLEVAQDTELVPFTDRVRLRHGSARFDVKHRPERTFRVLVPDGEVRVLGTLFDVDAKPSSTLVHLLAGRLEVQCATQVERLEDGDSATIGAGRLTKLAAAAHADAGPGVASDATVGGRPADAFPSDVAVQPDVPVTPGGHDPRPTVQATAATGPAPEGLK